MFTGLIIKESLKPDAMLGEMGLKIVRTEKWNVGERAADFQPGIWHALFVEGDEGKINSIAYKLSLHISPQWYANMSNAGTEYVIFHGKVFKHRKGDRTDAAAAVKYGRSVGIPEHQLDWIR
ncbi:MAG: hypothetical protein KAU50_00935 [Candidatus Marinimicrobia bacterium]|nr:hypothetical protein [Candidatus Neomarinimicrobiota bacterium]